MHSPLFNQEDTLVLARELAEALRYGVGRDWAMIVIARKHGLTQTDVRRAIYSLNDKLAIGGRS